MKLKLSCNLGINSSNMLEYYEYKRIGINTCDKLLIYRKKWFLFHGIMKSPTSPHKGSSHLSRVSRLVNNTPHYIELYISSLCFFLARFNIIF